MVNSTSRKRIRRIIVFLVLFICALASSICLDRWESGLPRASKRSEGMLSTDSAAQRMITEIRELSQPAAIEATSRILRYGRVFDATSRLPLEGAELFLSDARLPIGRSSFRGEYRVLLDPSTSELRFARTGYESRTLQIRHSETQPAEVFLEPSNIGTLQVSWAGGLPAADIPVFLSTRPALAAQGSLSPIDFPPIARTDADGVAVLCLGEPSHAFVRTTDGSFGSTLLQPRGSARIVLPTTGALLRFESTEGGVSETPFLVNLLSLDGMLSSGVVSFLSQPGDQSPIRLAAGYWRLSIARSPYVIRSADVDGVVVDPDMPLETVIHVSEQAERVLILLSAGLRVRLLSAVTRQPIRGGFTYGILYRTRTGELVGVASHDGMTDAEGRARLLPIAPDLDSRTAYVLALDTAGFRTTHVSVEQIRPDLATLEDVEVLLEPCLPTDLLLSYRDGTPFRGTIRITADGHGGRRIVYAGDTEPDGRLIGLPIEAREFVQVFDIRENRIASLAENALIAGRVNAITVDQGYGRLRIRDVPDKAPGVAILDVAGGLDYACMEHQPDLLLSEPIPPGEYFVGPHQVAAAERAGASAWGGMERGDWGRHRVVIRAGEEVTIGWDPRWGPSRGVEGRVEVHGSEAGDLFLVPVYSDSHASIRWGPVSSRVYLSESGAYSLPAGGCPPTLLLVCALDSAGMPVPIDAVAPGGDAYVRYGTVRMIWEGTPSPQSEARVFYEIDASAFAVPVKLITRRFEQRWDLRQPMLLRPLPVGECAISVQTDAKWFEGPIAKVAGGVTDVRVRGP